MLRLLRRPEARADDRCCIRTTNNLIRDYNLIVKGHCRALYFSRAKCSLSLHVETSSNYRVADWQSSISHLLITFGHPLYCLQLDVVISLTCYSTFTASA